MKTQYPQCPVCFGFNTVEHGKVLDSDIYKCTDCKTSFVPEWDIIGRGV